LIAVFEAKFEDCDAKYELYQNHGYSGEKADELYLKVKIIVGWFLGMIVFTIMVGGIKIMISNYIKSKEEKAKEQDRYNKSKSLKLNRKSTLGLSSGSGDMIRDLKRSNR